MRLLKLPPAVQALLQEGKLSAGHARALLPAADPAALAQRVVALGLSVRQTEVMASRAARPARRAVPTAKDADTRALENDLARALGLKVEIDHGKGAEGGRLIIQYRSLEQLDAVIRCLRRED